MSLAALIVAAAAHGAEPLPAWLTEARAREGKLVAPHPVASADKAIHLSVPLPLAGKPDEDADSFTVTLALAPQVSGECVVLKRDIDVAAFMREAARITFKETIEKAQGKVEYRALEKFDTGLAGSTPYIGATWIYRANDGSGGRVGGLRQYAARHAGHGVYCALNDLGYGQTFEKAVIALVDSLRTGDEQPDPYFREVSLIAIGDARVGYSEIEMRRDSDGDSKNTERMVMIVPSGAEDPRTLDSIGISWVTPSGQLINAQRVSAVNGEIDADVGLKQVEDGGWVMSGSFKSKDVKATLPEAAPSTWISQTQLRRELLAKPSPVGAQATRTDWSAVNPGEFMNTTVKVLSAIDADTYHVQESNGAVTMDLVTNRATGQATQGTMELGPAKVVATRVLVQGTP